MVGPRGDDQVTNQIPSRVGQNRFRRRVTSENLSVNGSARHRLPAQLITGNLAEVRRLDFVNTLRRRLRAGRLGVNLAAQARDNRACMVTPPPQQHQQQQQQRGGAPASADHGQGQGQPEGGKKKPPKETPPPRPQ